MQKRTDLVGNKVECNATHSRHADNIRVSISIKFKRNAVQRQRGVRPQHGYLAAWSPATATRLSWLWTRPLGRHAKSFLAVSLCLAIRSWGNLEIFLFLDRDRTFLRYKLRPSFRHRNFLTHIKFYYFTCIYLVSTETFNFTRRAVLAYARKFPWGPTPYTTKQ